MTIKKQPQIRFGGFGGDWEEKTLKEISSGFDYGLNAAAKKFDGKHKYLRITDIDDETRQFLTSALTSPDADFSQSEHYKLQAKDLLFARTGATVGKTYLYQEQDGLVYFAGFLIRARISDDFDEYFIFSKTRTSHYDSFIKLTSQRSGQPGINAKEYAEYSFRLPEKPEQIVIGQFFRQLDEMLTLAEQKHAQTVQLKKAMLGKLFPISGSLKPQIRLKGFSGDWVERKLGDLGEIVMGQSPDSANYTDNPNDMILVQGNADLKNGKVVPRVWTTQITKTAKKGSLLISVRAPVGDVGKTDFDIVIGRGISAIQGNEFIYQTLVKMKLDNYWTSVSAGSTFESINGDDIKNAVILCPNIAEQTAIGKLFQTLDYTIALQAQEIAQIKQLKSALLGKMFV